MANKISYSETPEFKKDLKQLLKKFRSLEDDLGLAKKAAIEFFHIGVPDARGTFERKDTGAIFPITGFGNEEIQVCKVKKFACRSLKGRGARSGIRIIYVFHRAIAKVVFIEIYFKGEQENEDRERIRKYLKKL